MADLKHVGKIKNTGKKVLVAYRTLPGDAYSCLVIPTESLLDDQHNSLIQLVESPAAQQAFEFHEVLARAKFPDGSTMLPTLHVQGKLLKVSTDKVEMTPNFNVSISLAELNQLIAEQKGIAVDDLSVKDPNIKSNVEIEEVATIKDMSPSAKTTSSSVNDDLQPVAQTQDPITFDSPDAEAKFYRSQADKLAKQAAEMRRKAEELSPTTKKKKEAVSE
jgi:hypothetical protein